MDWNKLEQKIVKDFNINIDTPQLIHSLVEMTELRDSYTLGHSKRVAEYAYMLAKDMQENEDFLKRIYLAGLLHDIGKIGIPDVILLKPARLNDDEYELVKMHSTLSYKILYHIKEFNDILLAVKHHHERWNGSGYPNGLKETKIPKMARYLAIVDVWDALTTQRIYRKAMKLDEALNILKKEKNLYDPKIYQFFITKAKEYYHKVDKSKKIIYPKLEEHRNDFFFRDHLTSTFNREALLYFVKKGADRGYPIYIGRFNIKNFALYNRMYGASEGDKLLITITRLILQNLEVFNVFGEIAENKFYLFRAYADHFYILYFGKRFEYLNITLSNLAEYLSQKTGVKIEFYKLIAKENPDPNRILREIDFLL